MTFQSGQSIFIVIIKKIDIFLSIYEQEQIEKKV